MRVDLIYAFLEERLAPPMLAERRRMNCLVVMVSRSTVLTRASICLRMDGSSGTGTAAAVKVATGAAAGAAEAVLESVLETTAAVASDMVDG